MRQFFLLVFMLTALSITVVMPAGTVNADASCITFSVNSKVNAYTYSPSILTNGQAYVIVASGQATYTSGRYNDFFFSQKRNAGPEYVRNYHIVATPNAGLPLNVDYNPEHIYTWEMVGNGAVIGFKFVDDPSSYFDNNGSYTVQACPDLRAEFDASPRSGDAPLEVTFDNHSVGADFYVWNFDDGIETEVVNPIHTFSRAGTYTVTLTAYADGGTRSDSTTKTINVGTDENTLYKPVRAAEAYVGWASSAQFDYTMVRAADPDYFEDFGDWNYANPLSFWSGALNPTHVLNPDSNTVIATTAIVGQNIYSARGGTVSAVQKISSCTVNVTLLVAFSTDASANYCLIKIPAPLTGAGDYVYRFDVTNAYLVTVTFGAAGQVLEYVVDNPQVAVGDVIEGGCIIGKSISLLHLVPLELATIGASLGTTGPSGEIAFSPTSPITGIGVATLTLRESDGSSLRLLPRLILDSTSLTPCNLDPMFRSCAGDPDLRYPSQWFIEGGVIWDSGQKPILQPNARISQQLPLTGAESYSLIAQVDKLDSNPGAVVLGIGQTQTPFTLDAVQGRYTIPRSVHAPDAGLVYTVSITNTGRGPIQVISLCITSDAEIDNQPAVCYFRNPSFDEGLSGWSTGGANGGIMGGEIIMPNNSTVAQQAALRPNGAESYEYAITIKATPYGTGWDSQTGSTAHFQFEYPAGSGFEDFLAPNSSAEYPFAYFKTDRPNGITFLPGNEVVFQGSIPVSTSQDSSLTIKSLVNLAPGFSGGILVREICINDPFSEWDTEGGGPGLPFVTNCSVISPPTDEALSSWTFYLWSSLDRFYNCDMMTLLNRMYNVGNDTLKLLRWQALYWQSVFLSLVNWFTQQFVPWLGGHFRNIANGRVTTITPGASASLWDVLLALLNGVVNPFFNFLISLLTQASNLMFSVITAMLGILLALFGQLIGLLRSLIDGLLALVGAWNNAPAATLPFVPNCAADVRSNAFCLAVWTLENTVFSGPGVLLIPLVIGFSAINLLLWIVSTLKKTFVEIGQDS